MLADTITALMAANAAYLFVINAVIGILEGKLLKRWFSGGSRAVWWMIAANYASAWIGWFALIWVFDPHFDSMLGPRPIERINSLALAVLLISFAITVVVEFGFVHFATEPSKRSPGRLMLATLCVNAVSYVILCVWFLWTSFSLPFYVRVSALSDLGRMPGGTLFWVDPSGRVMARDLFRGESDHKVAQVMRNDFVKPFQLRFDRSENPQTVQLDVAYSATEYADRPTPPNPKPPDPLVLADAGPAASFPADYWDQPRILLMSVLDLRPKDRRQMQVRFDVFLKYLDTDVPDGPHSHLYMGFATIEWSIHEPTVLPDDKVVFEWSGQIVLFDPHTRKLAFIASGTCPAFLPPSKPKRLLR